MNRTALSVIALAVGSVLIIGLFNIYKPAVSHVAHDVFSKVHINHLGMKEHKYEGLYYTDDHHGNIEFTHGTLSRATTDNWYARDAVNNFYALTNGNAPKDLKEARTIKFDDSVDFSHAHNLDGLLANSSSDGLPNNLESVDMGNNFDTSHVDNSSRGLSEMFIDNFKLKHVNLGSKFKVNPNVNMFHLFWNDNQLKQSGLTGNVPQSVRNKIGAPD